MTRILTTILTAAILALGGQNLLAEKGGKGYGAGGVGEEHKSEQGKEHGKAYAGTKDESSEEDEKQSKEKKPKKEKKEKKQK